ncbi:Phosphoenolpyruvate carboxylase 3 [Abeliophyllum distichum]|uniref:Phosphoenolpyruvate carboxylase n=1 Tax=Abeliophyllum distichum TaxID=126358 RepID=A0ABD1PS73_9LAMI
MHFVDDGNCNVHCVNRSPVTPLSTSLESLLFSWWSSLARYAGYSTIEVKPQTTRLPTCQIHWQRQPFSTREARGIDSQTVQALSFIQGVVQPQVLVLLFNCSLLPLSSSLATMLRSVGPEWSLAAGQYGEIRLPLPSKCSVAILFLVENTFLPQVLGCVTFFVSYRRHQSVDVGTCNVHVSTDLQSLICQLVCYLHTRTIVRHQDLQRKRVLAIVGTPTIKSTVAVLCRALDHNSFSLSLSLSDPLSSRNSQARIQVPCLFEFICGFRIWMASRNLEKLASIDAQLRLLVPGKVSEDDKLVEYDALLLDRFLDILQDLHGEDLKETVQECYELSAEYEGGKHDPKKLEELGNVLTSLDPGDSIVVAKAFSHMLNLANLAEEVQIAYRRRNKKKKGDYTDEMSATTESDIEETLKRLVVDLKKSPQEVFDALKNQTVDLVFTAHPTQSVRRSLLQKHGRIRNCLAQLYAKDITPDDKQELDEALQREIQAAFRTDEIRRTPPTPQDEMRAGMSYFHETIWNGVPKFLRRVDTALKNIGINERVPYNAPLIQFSSWMGGDRDGNPRVTPEVTRDVCLLARMMAAKLYYSQIEDLMFELSMWRCSDELRVRADELHRSSKRDAKHYIEFWKQVPPNEPYRVILGEVRDKLYQTRERSRHLLANGVSDIPEEATYTNVEQFLEPLELCYSSLCACGDRAIADGSLLDFLRQVSTFGLSLVRLDIRQESDRHTDVLDAITKHLEIGSYREWSEERRQEWLLSELSGKRPLFGPDLPEN